MAAVDIVEVATQVVEAAGALGTIYTGYKLLGVAKDYYALYKEQREFYYNTFQYGVEGPLAAAILADPINTLDHTGQAATIYDTETGPFGGSAGDIGGWWDRHAAMYNVARDSTITELPVDTARLQSDWANFLFRFEEHYVDIQNDIRWNRRLAVHNIGLKQGAYISSALATSFSAYESALDSTADALSATANGAAQYSGYRRGMADTNADFLRYGYRSNSNTPDSGKVRSLDNKVHVGRGEVLA